MFKVLSVSRFSVIDRLHAEAVILDAQFPALSRDKFQFGTVIPLAGQSLGSPFTPSVEAIALTSQLRATHLHQPHWTTYDIPGSGVKAGNWFDCDVEPGAVKAVGRFLGFQDPDAFCFGRGLSDNLALLLTGFYRPKLDTHNKIAFLGNEFGSDQQVFASVVRNKQQTFADAGLPAKPETDLLLKLKADSQGIYSEDDICAAIKANAKDIAVIVLSEIVFNTGQRLNIQKIMDGIKDVVRENNIIVGLDLAHVVGNRPTHLEAYGVHFAVGCSYKFTSQDAGNPFGWYIRPDITAADASFLQGWKAIQSDKAFGTISSMAEPQNLHQNGAKLARISNPAPQSIVGEQVFMDHLVNKVGIEAYVAQSERLTTFLLQGLKALLGDRLQLITPEEPERRGATLCFKIDGVDVGKLEHFLKDHHGIEVDTRPPVMRVMAHGLYNTFHDVSRLLTGIFDFLAANNL